VFKESSTLIFCIISKFKILIANTDIVFKENSTLIFSIMSKLRDSDPQHGHRLQGELNANLRDFEAPVSGPDPHENADLDLELEPEHVAAPDSGSFVVPVPVR
jgi:hypothetical protein